MITQPQATDILILSNGPGELTTWVRPVVKALRQQLGHDRQQVRLSLVLSPCANASGKEVAIARTYLELDRIQGAEHFFPFLLWGKTQEHWDWRDRGLVLFLGGDQFFPVVIGNRLGYRSVVYAEWETRWHRWIDQFAVMNQALGDRAPHQYAHKFTVVGDLMAEAGRSKDEGGRMKDEGGRRKAEGGRMKDEVGNQDALDSSFILHPSSFLIALLPGSKPAKLAQGVPLTLAIAQQIQAVLPQTRFVIPVAPTLDVSTLARYADPAQNPVARYFGPISAMLITENGQSRLKTNAGLEVPLYTDFPAYDLLSQCTLCLTTVGANTAELGSLAVPMLVLLPTQQLDAMRAWDGLPGLLVNLPGVGSGLAKLVNWWFLRKPRLLAWPNIWAGEAIVPELVGNLEPAAVAAIALDLLTHPDQLAAIRANLRQVRGEPGAANKLAQLVVKLLEAQLN